MINLLHMLCSISLYVYYKLKLYEDCFTFEGVYKENMIPKN